MENKEWIYILDYSDCTICEIVHNIDDERELEDILEEYGCNVDTCSFMITDHKIESITELSKD